MIDYFQTLNVKRFIFVDCDNVSTPNNFIDFLIEHNYISIDSQVICFIGANQNQNTWYNNAVKYIQKNKINNSFNFTPIRIYKEGQNALDFVLSSYVGLSIAHNQTADFIIMSQDKGYEAIVSHFKSIGVSISQQFISKEEAIPSIIATDAGIINKNAKKIKTNKIKLKNIMNKFLADSNRRPSNVEKLKNYFSVNIPYFTELEEKEKNIYFDAIKNTLKQRNIIEINDNKITWLDKSNGK